MKQFYPTPHIQAVPSDFAPTVLMPGDPLRAERIAKTFFTNPRLVNNVRGVQGYTGTYRGAPVSVMASGMGMPSMGIYAHELFGIFGVEQIIRVGSVGSLNHQVKLRDLVLAQGACTDSAFASQMNLPGSFAPLADFALLSHCARLAGQSNLPFHVGNILTSDHFYQPDPTVMARWGAMGVLGVEMETAALYMTAAQHRKKALAICTVSDHLLSGESLSAMERQTSFEQMITLALQTAVSL